MNPSPVVGRALVVAALAYCVTVLALCVGLCAGCAEWLSAPRPPPATPPASGPSWNEWVEGFRALVKLVKLCITLGFVMAKGLSLTTATWADLQELITRIDRSNTGLGE